MRRTVTEAYVLRRVDFQETSRILTLFTRELGMVACLARGAHREASPFVGAVDLLLRVEATLGGGGEVKLLSALRVLHGNAAFLAPGGRFAAAMRLAALWIRALPEGRRDVELYDLFRGGLLLVERVPPAALPKVELALELRFLAALGLLADLARCALCGSLLSEAFLDAGTSGGLSCPRHGRSGRRLPPTLRALLARLATAPSRELQAVPAPPRLLAEARTLAALLLDRLLDRPPGGATGWKPATRPAGRE